VLVRPSIGERTWVNSRLSLAPQDYETALDKSLTDLGANSVDRVEVVLYSLEDLKLEVPTAELHGIRDLKALVDLLYRHATVR
jgi:acyl carrier protein